MSIPIDDFPGGGGGSPPVTIVTTGLNAGNVGTPYFQYLDASGGYTPYTWTLDSGSLPSGLSIDVSGFISGTPTVAGTSTFVISVQDSIGGIDTKELSIQIDAATNPTITTTSLPPGPEGVAYSQTIVAEGGTPPYTAWNVIIGTLPTGLTLDSSGLLSGTPTVAGTYNFTIEVTDTASATDIQAFSLIIQSNTPTITTISLPSGTTGISYTTNISATGGTTPYTNWQIISGSLPTGLSLTSSPTVGTISGIPTEFGTYNFTVEVTDSNSATDDQILSITINNGELPIIYTNSFPFAPVDTAYSTFVQASGGSLPYNWSILSGSLPSGLSLNSSTGEISGTPTVIGSYIFTIKVIDYNGNIDTKLFSITVDNYILPAITTDSLPNGIVGTSYSTYVQGIGGQMPYSWGILGLLPDGLSIDNLTGEISGTPTTPGTYNFNIILLDDASNVDINNFTIIIGDGTLPIITTTSIHSGDLDVYYSKTLNALGGIPGYTWSIDSGSLPPGLTLSSTGIISGIPSSIGLYNVTVKVTDSDLNIDTQNYNIIIRSTGFDSTCCFCVFTNEVINFETNGTNGVLTATGGTIISNSKWQAPSISGIYNVNINVDGINGTISSYNTITVVEKIEITNVTKDLDYLLPGDIFDIETNYDKSLVTWETIGCDYPIITPSGTVFINTSVADTCYGALECTVRGTVSNQEFCNDLTNYIDLKIKVNPIYPTPDNCGPFISKWLRESPEFKVLTTDFEGGCDETHIKNKVPTYRWTINYDGLYNYQTAETTCPNCKSCIAVCGCNPEYSNNTGECHPILKSANRLDDFWNMVYGTYKKFTLVDYDTGEVWYNVRFEDRPSNDHRHRRRVNSRTIKLIWKPCCNTSPSGGTCSKHGMFNYKPSKKECVINTCHNDNTSIHVNILGLETTPEVGYYGNIINFSVEGFSQYKISHINIYINDKLYDTILQDSGEIIWDTRTYTMDDVIHLYKIEAVIYDIYGNASNSIVIVPVKNDSFLMDDINNYLIDNNDNNLIEE